MTAVSPAGIGPAAGAGMETELRIVEPRCKVCRSEHRATVDEMLRHGDSQAAVRRHVNALVGHAAFTANNLSVHARNHLYGPDPDEWIRKRARAQRMLGDPSNIPAQTTPHDALRTVMEVGLRLIDVGVTVPEPGDIVRAAKELNRIQREGRLATEDDLVRELKAFMKAVKNRVPEDEWDEIYFEYERIIGVEGA